MSATEALRNCPVCNELYLQEGTRSLESHIGRERYSCKRCGTYDVDKHIVRSQDFDKVRHLVSAWIRRQNDSGIFPVVVGSGINTKDSK
jgi:hypothetical protein